MFLQLKDQFWVCITWVQIPGLQWLFFCIGKDLPDQLVKDLPIQPLLWKIKTQISFDDVKPWTRIKNLFPSLMFKLHVHIWHALLWTSDFSQQKQWGPFFRVHDFPSSWPAPNLCRGIQSNGKMPKGPWCWCLAPGFKETWQGPNRPPPELSF